MLELGARRPIQTAFRRRAMRSPYKFTMVAVPPRTTFYSHFLAARRPSPLGVGGGRGDQFFIAIPMVNRKKGVSWQNKEQNDFCLLQKLCFAHRRYVMRRASKKPNMRRAYRGRGDKEREGREGREGREKERRGEG